ncbi:hypothetical protein NG798_24735 [Ancylothrix sp. C2]|nr:hypothetical protein [Ancylothrix sp. D3o]MCT7953009.1 hypothetical protein [Ancylothrix sp. D3o]
MNIQASVEIKTLVDVEGRCICERVDTADLIKPMAAVGLVKVQMPGI